jgi:hypothetical protein
MKNFKWLTIVIISMFFLISMVSLGWSIEVQKGPMTMKPVVQLAVPHCPSGFTMAPDGSKCTRNKPANPCASGFHVEWGTCIQGTGLGAQDPYPCGYKCIPNMPAPGSYMLKCPPKTGPNPIAGSCEIWCPAIIY